MPRKTATSGVRAKGKSRIEFDFEFAGRRYRPTLKRLPTEANLRRAMLQLEDIKDRIKNGTFLFADEFPDYRFSADLDQRLGKQQKTCANVMDEFLAHCEKRVVMNDMAFSTLNGYRKILDAVWRPKIGEERFASIVFSQLLKIASDHTANKKTYNNVVSVVRATFAFGHKDHPELHNPALGLKTLRIGKKDRPHADPFTIDEGELIIARSHAEFGQAHGNYEEFRFFTGLRQSEQLALLTADCDTRKGTIQITKAWVLGRDKDRTKTGEDRTITLCPRALEVLARQLTLRTRMIEDGRIQHEHVFFQQDGAPIGNLSYPYDRWRYVVQSAGVRYRDAYNARHSFISWSLMAGKPPLLLAEESGHSVATMLTKYAAWTKGATEEDIKSIRAAMEKAPRDYSIPSDPLPFVTTSSLGKVWGRLSWRKYSQRNGGADGTRI